MFTKFVVALATSAIVADAYYQPQAQYSPYQSSYYGSRSTPSSAYSAPQRSSYEHSYPQHAQYGYGQKQPVYNPTYANAQSSYARAPSSYAHAPQRSTPIPAHAQSYAAAPTPEPVQAHPHAHETHEYNEGCDIGGQHGGSSQNFNVYDFNSRWWSPTEEFSPPLHPFVPSKDIPPIGVYAGCVTINGENAGVNRDDSGDTILFAQLPGQSTSVKTKEGDFFRGLGGNRNKYKFVIYEGGQIVNSAGENCDLTIVGDEFNPLAEIENDIENPYSDMTRGRISDVFGEGETRATAVSLDQPNVLLNILGKNSILGRSLFVFEKRNDADFRTEAEYCCVIARMAPPTTMVSNVTWVQPNEAPHHHHYNSYSQNDYSGY